MTSTNTRCFWSTVVGVAIIIMAVLSFWTVQPAKASQPGVKSQVATSSSIQVGPQQNIAIFGTTSPAANVLTQCSGRIITTTNSAVMLSFDTMGSTSLNGNVGHWQAASSTVLYPSQDYGCGYFTAFGYASSTITRTELR